MAQLSVAFSSSGPPVIRTGSALALAGSGRPRRAGLAYLGCRPSLQTRRRREPVSSFWALIEKEGQGRTGATPLRPLVQRRLPSYWWLGGRAAFLTTAGVLNMAGVTVTNSSVSVCMKATRSFSSALLKPRLPIVKFLLSCSSGVGQHVIFSTVPVGQCPDWTLKAYLSRVL